MSSISKEQIETLALIDAIMAMTEKRPENFYLDVNLSLNPFEFLMDIIMKSVSFEDMVNWLVDIITQLLPTIELGVKGILLSNLKSMVDCNNDPRIPDWIRMPNQGMKFNLSSIDHRNMMSISPLTPEGTSYYFGTRTYYTIDGDKEEGKKYNQKSFACNSCIKQGIPLTKIKKNSECSNVYQLARAEDFNAFLWFVVHKSILNTPTNGGTEIYGIYEGEDNITTNSPSYSPGCTLKHGSLISLCIEGGVGDYKSQYVYSNFNDLLTNDYKKELSETDFSERVYKWKFVPVSKDTNSVNWYVNNGTFFNFIKEEKYRIPRDYSKEYAICNLKYNIEEKSIVVSVLPKPSVYIPKLDKPKWLFKPILFNYKGEPDNKGKYTCDSGNYTLNEETGEYSLNGGVEKLYECYPKLTVYEFNYDFVMGMQLFDPSIIAARLIESVIGLKFNSKLSANFRISKSETAYQMRIANIVKNIIESTAYEVSDCFYSFDNAKYDSMLRDAEIKRSQLFIHKDDNNKSKKVNGNSVYDILNEFDNNATLNENKEVVKRAITQATANITEEVLPEDKYSIQFNVVKELINSLTFSLVENLITPKIVLLFEVNRTLMGQYAYEKNKDYDIEFFLKTIEGLIVQIVREIRDIILQQLLDWCLKILAELNLKAVELLVKEQLEYYSRLMKLLFKACSFKSSRRAALDSELDKVDYADIDEIDKPKESNC